MSSLRPVRLQIRTQVNIPHGNAEELTDSQQAQLDLPWWIARKGRMCREGSRPLVEAGGRLSGSCVIYAGDARERTLRTEAGVLQGRIVTGRGKE